MITPREIAVQQWYMIGLSEGEARELVGHISGTKQYNMMVAYHKLPEQAKKIIREAYDKAQSEDQ